MSWLLLALPAAGLAATALVAYLSVRLVQGSAERLRARQTEQPLAHELPYWAFLDVGARGTGSEPIGVAVHVDLTYSACLELAGLDPDCMDDAALNQVSLVLHGVVQSLPAHVVLQFSHWTDGDVTSVVDAYRAQAEGDHTLGRMLVADKAETLLRTRGLRRSHLLLTVSVSPSRSDSVIGRDARRAGWDCVPPAGPPAGAMSGVAVGDAPADHSRLGHSETVCSGGVNPPSHLWLRSAGTKGGSPELESGTGHRLPAAGTGAGGRTPVAGAGARTGTGTGTGSDLLARLRFFHRPAVLSAARHDESVTQLRTLVDQVASGLEAAGVKARPLRSCELRRHIYQRLNPTHVLVAPEPPASSDDQTAREQLDHQGRRRPQRAEPAEPPTVGLPTGTSWSDSQTAREQLIYSGILEQRDSLLVDGQLMRVLTMKALPTSTEPALLETLLVGLPFHCRVNVAIETTDSIRALDDLKRRRDQAHLLATLREKRNQEAEAQEEDVSELIDRNLRSSVRMVRLALSVVLSVDAHRPDAANVLDAQTHEVKRVVAGLCGAQILVDEHAQLDELLATLPGNARRGRRWRRCTSENAAHLLLAWQAWTGDPRPALLVQNGRGELVGLDPFDESLDNPNAFMAGASGSGKSATTNYLLLNLIASGAKALVIDVGGSYRRLLEIFGGKYFAITVDGADHALNPFFDPIDIVRPDGKLEERRLQFVLAVLERMACDGARRELGNAERALLAAAIEATYRGTPGRAPILSDLLVMLRGHKAADDEDVAIARRLARDLRVWAEGPAARLINRASTLGTIGLTTELAAFDLKGLESEPQLQAVVMLILSGIIWNLVMKDRTGKKVVVFDEVWRLLESPSSARLVAELYRTSRKYRASILTISQAVEDFTSSPIATALTNNSATVYLLKHRRGHETVAGQFHLNAREEEVFRGLEMRRGEYTEALVLHGDHHFLARIVLSPLEYWIATSHPADHELEAELGRSQPHLTRLDLLRLLAARFPRGASAGTEPAADAA